MSNREANHVVVGIGSPYGDDIAGWLVVDDLASRDRPNVTAARVADTTGIFPYLANCSYVWIVDACHGGNAPGTIRRWQWPDVPVGSRSNSSTHAISLTDTLRLAAQLNRLPAQVVVYGIEIAEASPESEFVSRPVQAAVPQLAQLILSEIEDSSGKAAPASGEHARQ